ncbi:hypothetical protein Avbf_04275 [Armadillidium vulgare]|nr:hypothetical protein Avbf_04275 [Armadillidium vulgare]
MAFVKGRICQVKETFLSIFREILSKILRSSRDYESSVEASGGTDAETDVSINVSINSDEKEARRNWRGKVWLLPQRREVEASATNLRQKRNSFENMKIIYFVKKQEPKLDQVESSQQRPVNNTSCHSRNFSLPSVSEASNLNGERLIDGQPYSKAPSTLESDLHSFSDVVQSKNFAEIEETTEIETNALERDKERRSARKLTKDSGYETSPHSEGDYTNIELLQAEGEASTEGNVDAQLVEVKADENFKIIERSEMKSKLSKSEGKLEVVCSNEDEESCGCD